MSEQLPKWGLSSLSIPFLNKSRLILTVCCLVGLTGCGGSDGDTPPLHQVSGTLTHKLKPVANVYVNMTVEGKRPSTGLTNESGEFTMTYTAENPGVVAGENRVTLAPFSSDPDVNPIPKDQVEIMDKYSEGKSTLTITIDQDHDQYDLKLD